MTRTSIKMCQLSNEWHQECSKRILDITSSKITSKSFFSLYQENMYLRWCQFGIGILLEVNVGTDKLNDKNKWFYCPIYVSIQSNLIRFLIIVSVFFTFWFIIHAAPSSIAKIVTRLLFLLSIIEYVIIACICVGNDAWNSFVGPDEVIMYSNIFSGHTHLPSQLMEIVNAWYFVEIRKQILNYGWKSWGIFFGPRLMLLHQLPRRIG